MKEDDVNFNAFAPYPYPNEDKLILCSLSKRR